MKLFLKILAGIAGLIIVLVAGLAVALLATAVKPDHPVGFQQFVVADPGHKPVAVAVWYPTDAPPGRALVGTMVVRLATDAPVKGAGLPLVFLSHGTGGAAQGHVDTALALASAGFVVAAPTHTGDNFRDDAIVGTSAWFVDRARQISLVTDFMVGRWASHTQIDPARVGIFGFSAGATTALIAAGGTPDIARFAADCAAHPEFVCKLGAPGATLVNPPAWPRTPRIAAAVIAAPGLGFSFAPAGLADVKIPVQLWQGAADDRVPYATNAGVIRQLLPQPPEFHSVPGAVHLSFLTPCGLIGPPPLCSDPAGFDRKAFHRDFNAQIVAFFEANLPKR